MGNKIMRGALALGAGLAAFAALPAQAANWQEYYYHAETGVHFYYDVDSVNRQGTISFVRWYDSNGITPNETGRKEWLVFTARIDCAARTVQSLEVDRVDAQTGSYITTVDLRGASNNQPQAISPGSNMAEYLRQRAC